MIALINHETKRKHMSYLLKSSTVIQQGCLCLFLLLMAGLTLASDVPNPITHVNGSSTVYLKCFASSQAELKTLGDVVITPTSSGQGLQALLQCNADIAMVSADINNLIDNIPDNIHNKEALSLNQILISDAQIQFITNERQPIPTITADQLKSILEGTLTHLPNDQGEPQQIKLKSESQHGGMYDIINSVLLSNQGFSPTTQFFKSAPEVAFEVSKEDFSLGYISSELPHTLRQGVKLVEVTQLPDLKQQLSLVVDSASSFRVITMAKALQKKCQQSSGY